MWRTLISTVSPTILQLQYIGVSAEEGRRIMGGLSYTASNSAWIVIRYSHLKISIGVADTFHINVFGALPRHGHLSGLDH